MTPEHESTAKLVELHARLRAARAVPSAGFRGELRRRLLAQSEKAIAPQRLRLLIIAYAGTGTALLAIAAIGVAGVGPFGV